MGDFQGRSVKLPEGKLTQLRKNAIFSFQWVKPLFLWPFSIAFCMFTREYQSYVEFWEPRWPRLENLGVSHLRYARNVEVKLIQP